MSEKRMEVLSDAQLKADMHTNDKLYPVEQLHNVQRKKVQSTPLIIAAVRLLVPSCHLRALGQLLVLF